MTDPIDLNEFRGAFVIEAEELVAGATTALLEIEAAIDHGTSRPRAVRDLFRALHTIKGLASMIGVAPIVELAHALEALIRAAEVAGGALHRRGVETALEGVAAIAARVRAVADHQAVEGVPDGLIARIASTVPEIVAAIPTVGIPPEWEPRLSPSERQQLALALEAQAPVWSLSFVPSEANAARGITITTVRAGLGAIGEIIKVIPRTVAARADATVGVAFELLFVGAATRIELAAVAATDPALVVEVARPAPTAAEPRQTEPSAPRELASDDSPLGRAVVRVELPRLDELQDQLSLLITSRFRLEREIAAFAELGHDVRRLHEIVRIQGRQLRDLRRAILRARMVRVAEVLEPLTLLVRGLVRSTGRTALLELDARDVELDKAVADRLLPALIHLVRNAVDHAVDPPDQRVALGKPEVCTVQVSCREIAAHHVEVVVRDDGRGIDRAAIARRARCTIDDDAKLLEVLTSAGFSTQDVASTTSGRGIGLDIVRRIADDLGGHLSMTTLADVGTSFTLRVPITITVMDVLSFQCGSQAFVVPIAVVDEVIEVAPDDGRPTVSSLAPVARGGQALSVVSLGALLAVDSGARARKALVVRRDGGSLAFTVDRLLGRQEVVVRTLEDPLVAMPGVAGTTDLGDGQPTLVLDLNVLGLRARQRCVE